MPKLKNYIKIIKGAIYSKLISSGINANEKNNPTALFIYLVIYLIKIISYFLYLKVKLNIKKL